MAASDSRQIDILRAKIGELARAAGKDQMFADDESIFLSGRLDSVTLVELVAFLEKNFDLNWRDFGGDVRNIDTISSLARVVSSARSGAKS